MRLLKIYLNKIQENIFLSLFCLLFFIIVGYESQKKIAIDAIPNIGQNQVIVISKWEGRSPKDIEDQITYPLSEALLSVPGTTSVRGKSLFGFSFVQVTFSDNVDYYWARSRVSEQLPTVSHDLPEGVRPILGPDATGLGQIFYYVLEPTKPTNATKLRSLQDYIIKYALQSVEGVSEVASIGGYTKEYQIDLDPQKLRFHKIPIKKVISAIKESNIDIGAKTIEQSDMEFIIRGKGLLGQGKKKQNITEDIENTILESKEGRPLYIKDIAEVKSGNAFRRSALDLNGKEAVGGIVVMRLGENPRKVIDRVKSKISQLEGALGGIKIKAIYDRTKLIDETLKTLSDALFHEILITILVILIFLMHIKTSFVVAAVLPLSILLTFIIMRFINLDANIMSLAGIAIAIGNMVDIGIVLTENIYHKLAEQKNISIRDRIHTISEATTEVLPPLITATATTVISFLPVFFLTGRDYKLFSPLALTKTFALISALIISIFVVPLLSQVFIKKKLRSSIKNILPYFTALSGTVLTLYFVQTVFVSRFLILFFVFVGAILSYLLGKKIAYENLVPLSESLIAKIIHHPYEKILRKILHLKKTMLIIPFILVALGLFSWQKLKQDHWIGLDEGSFFYMPTMYPGISFTKAYEVLQTQGHLIKEIPEVENVLGKIGRADSALDPAPTSMIETYVMLKDKSHWRKDTNEDEIWRQITKKASVVGVTPASLLQPIEGRVVMLESGIKASMAIRIYGDSLSGLSNTSQEIATYLKTIESVDTMTINPDIVLGKPYVEFEVDRQKAARFGMSVSSVNSVISTALGGTIAGQTIEGRERYPIKVRYLSHYRDDLEKLKKIPVVTQSGQVVPLETLASMKTLWGPAVISSENARLSAHVSFTPSEGYEAIKTVDEVMRSIVKARNEGKLKIPHGYELEAVGSFQSQIEANKKLLWLIPLVILINFIIIYLMFKALPLSLLAFIGIPLSFGGGMLILLLFGIKINTAIWIGFIALFGIAVDNGVILCSYLQKRFKSHPPKTKDEIIENIVFASLKRVRPCLMTTLTTIIALLPVLLSQGRGAQVAKGMAYPIFGGMFSSLLVLIILPVLYFNISKKNHKKI